MTRLVRRSAFDGFNCRVLTAAMLAAGALACMDDGPIATADATAGLRFSANVASGAVASTIEIDVMYRRASAETIRVPSRPERVSLEAGTTIQQAVTVDLAACLKDRSRAPANTPGCRLIVELRLVDDAGNTVDVQTREAPAPTAPGQTLELGNVTVGIQVGSVGVDLTSVRLNVTETQQLTGVVKDAAGATLGNKSVNWTSSDPTVAQLSAATGVGVTVRALKTGNATITASTGGKTSPPIPVTVAALEPLAVLLASTSVQVGTSVQLNVANPSGPVTWQSSDPSVASVDQNGLVLGVQARENNPVTITATSGSGPTQRTGTALVTVTSTPPLVISQQPAAGCVIVGQTLTFGVASAPAAVSWASDDAAVATVDPNSGVVTGRGAGQAAIRANSAGRSATAPICVVGPLGNVPPTLALTAGQVAQLSPSGTSNGIVGYSSDNTGVATVSSSGLITAVGVGQARITTTLGAASGSQPTTTTVTVNAAAITIAPNPVSVAVGVRQALTATARDANGKPLSGVTFAWSVNDAATAGLSGTSGNPVEVQGVKLGATGVRVSGGGAAGAAQVTVTRDRPASITVTLAAASLTSGQQTTASAEVKDAAGKVLTDQTVSWTTSSDQVATAASTGSRSAGVTTVGSGTADIIASIGTVSGKATVQVAAAPVTPAATMTLTPASASIVAGSAGQVLTAVVKDAQGNALVGRTVAWQVTAGDASVVQLSAASSASSATGASITVTGAKAGGPVTITATSGGRTATAQITVMAGAPASIAVTLAAASLTSGQQTTASAEVKDAAGNVLTNQTVTWTTSNAVASAASTGARTAVVTTAGTGSADVIASIGNVSGKATVHVGAVPVTPVAAMTLTPTVASIVIGGAGQVLTVVPRDAQGNALAGRTVAWQVTAGDASVVQLSATSNTSTAAGATITVTGVKAGGPVTITASSEGRTATTQITVTSGGPGGPGPGGPGTPGTPASISVTLGTTSLTIGQQTTATAEVRDATGAVLTGQTVTWTTSSTAVATVSSTGTRTGTVTGAGSGTADITAAIGSVSAKATVQVTAAPVTPVAAVTLAPTSASIAVGAGQALTAVPRDAQGNALAGRTVTWQVTAGDASVVQLSATSSTSTAAGATITVTGAKAGGPVTITATSESRTAASQITVTSGGGPGGPGPGTPGAPASITVSLADASLTIGQTTGATAEVKDGAGNVLTNQTVTWTTSSTAVATVSSTGARTGNVTAIGSGTADITASIGSLSGKATVQVAAAPVSPVDAVTLSPTSASIAVGAGQVLTAVPKDAQGNALAGRTVTWQVTNGDATVVQLSSTSTTSTAAGAVITVTGAKAGGPVTITATSEGKTATSQITVTSGGGPGGPGAPASITVTPPSVSLTVGQSSALTAVVKDAQGNTITTLPVGVALSWSSSNTSVASVAATSGQPFQASVTALAQGSTNVTATIPGIVSNAVGVTVSAVALPTIVADSPNNPTCAVNTFDCQFAVKVTNGAGQPLAGAEVDWAAPSVGCAETFRLTTDAQGRSATGNTCTTNIPGSYTQTATLVSTGQQVTFNFQLLGFTLSVQPLAGSTGNGRVTSTGGIGALDCTITAGVAGGASCAANFGPGAVVTLTAAASGGSAFAGWGGATCAEGGTTQATCTVTMSQSRSVTVNFAPAWGAMTVISQSEASPGVARRLYSLVSTGGRLEGLEFVGVTYPAEQQYKDFISNVVISGGTTTPTTITLDDCNCGRLPGSASTFYLTFRTSTPGVTPNPNTYTRTSRIPEVSGSRGPGTAGPPILTVPTDPAPASPTGLPPGPEGAPFGPGLGSVAPQPPGQRGPAPRPFANPAPRRSTAPR